MYELRRYAHDLIAFRSESLVVILPSGGSITFADFHRLQEIVLGLKPSVHLTYWLPLKLQSAVRT
jgi:hypothetical protein